jgi:hypothetical protein
MPTVIAPEGVFQARSIARKEGDGGLRLAVPAAIVRGLVHQGWQARWLDVRLNNVMFRVAVRPHPSSVMFGIPKRYCQQLRAGDPIDFELQAATGPRAPTKRRVRGQWRPVAAPLSLPWLGGPRK